VVLGGLGETALPKTGLRVTSVINSSRSTEITETKASLLTPASFTPSSLHPSSPHFFSPCPVKKREIQPEVDPGGRKEKGEADARPEG
jgi:hypothetical protein